MANLYLPLDQEFFMLYGRIFSQVIRGVIGGYSLLMTFRFIQDIYTPYKPVVKPMEKPRSLDDKFDF
jgi:hypothetical protein